MSTASVVGLVAYGMTIGVALAAPIGPINIEIIRRGIQGGYLRGWLVGLGAMTADTIYAALIVSGLTPVADRPALRVPLPATGTAAVAVAGGACHPGKGSQAVPQGRSAAGA